MITTSLVERVAAVLERRLSRRSFVNRSAFVGSAVAIGAGLDLALRPGTAYGSICGCANTECDCGSTCCSGFSEFCCSVNDGYNYCPPNTVMGGWWRADNSSYCNGPRYYMDCNATCKQDTGCGNGWPFCDPQYDRTSCGCGDAGCDSYATGCFQFRYGQCNQDVACMGRIVCRVVACVPPWEIDRSCTTANATDDSTAEQNAACWSAVPPKPPPVPCHAPATRCGVTGLAVAAGGGGYAVVTSFGKLFAYGSFPSDGDKSGDPPTEPVVAVVPSGKSGYWLVTAGGGVYPFGDAPYHGSTGGHPIAAPVVGMAATPSGDGYWLVAADGGIFAFGDAHYLGSMGGHPLTRPVVGMAATATGKGYWLVAADGGIFCFGDARFLGSTGGRHLAKPVVGMAAAPGGDGYWLVAADGGIFTFGNAHYEGSMGGHPLNWPVVGMAATADGRGYWLVAADGGLFSFGDAHFYGSPA